MKPETLATKIEGLIISANDRYADVVVKVQERLYNRLVTILKGIEVDRDGFIKQSAANRKILLHAQNEFDSIISESTYQKSLERYLKTIPSINDLNIDYFNTISTAFTPNRIFIKSLQSQTISSINELLLNDGLSTSVRLPLNQILNQNVNSGGSFSGMLEQLRTFIKGTPDLDGRLLSYSRNILADTLFQYSRAFQQSVTADLGLSWYRYIGGLIKDSREFCVERAGNFYHESEIKSWASLEWSGKNKYTTESSIFIYAGGHSCRHQIIPVSDSIVPKIDLDRV